MAKGGGGTGFGIGVLIVFWLIVIIVLPATYLLIGPDALLDMWRTFLDN